MEPNPFYRYQLPVLYFFTFLFFTAACKSKSEHRTTATVAPATYTASNSAPSYSPHTEQTPAYEPERNAYPDGHYCATVKYSNNNTGTHSLYILNVEVTDGKLSKIMFPNGGWLDDTHFNPPPVAYNGYAEFVNDRGYYYQVLIEHTGSCTYDEQVVNSLPDTSPRYSYDENDDDDESDEEEDEEKQMGKEVGVVVKRFDNCDYFIAETRKGLVILEWMGGYDPDEGDKIRGELSSFGTKDYYIINKDRTSRLWLDDYMLSEEDALEKIREECR